MFDNRMNKIGPFGMHQFEGGYCEATFRPSTPGFTRWLYLKA